jgi:hypothetical protein
VEISGRLLVKRRSLADFFCEDVVVVLRGGQCRLLCVCARARVFSRGVVLQQRMRVTI